jgi:hypothetical protein
MQNLTTYLTALITEKGRSTDDGIVREGHFGLTWQNLIEFCEAISPQDRKKIINTCTKIDFMNGDVFHFLNYLVDGMIQSMHGDNY